MPSTIQRLAQGRDDGVGIGRRHQRRADRCGESQMLPATIVARFYVGASEGHLVRFGNAPYHCLCRAEAQNRAGPQAHSEKMLRESLAAPLELANHLLDEREGFRPGIR